MAVTVTKLDAPSNVQASLQEGGNLLPNTTYYVVVTAKNYSGGVHYYAPIDGELISEPSEEISFTTTDTHKSAVITWTRPTGSITYNVYLSKVSGDYVDYKLSLNYVAAGHRCGRTGNDYSSSICDTAVNTDTYTISVEGEINTAYVCDAIGYGAIHDPNNPDMIMGLIPKGNGTINISYSGTYTLKQICDELISQGYGDYFYYNNVNLFVLRGSISVTGTTTGSLKILNHTLIFFNGTIQNTNPNCTLQLGDKSSENPCNGCSVYTNVLKLGYVKCYDTKFDTKLMGRVTYPHSIYVSDRTTVFGVSETMESCFFYEYATQSNVNMSNQYIFNQLANLRTYISLSNIPENAWNNVYISAYYINPQWYAFFRDCTFNITHPYYIGNPPSITNREHIFFDCNFIGKVWGQDYSTHRYYWSSPIGTQSARMVYMNSITAHIINADGNAISNAIVILKDKNGNTVLDTVSDIEGNTTKTDIRVYSIEQDITTSAGYDEARQFRVDYNPFTLIVSKEGYEDYILTFTHNTKLDTTISLNETKPVVYYHQQIDGSINQDTLNGTINTSTLIGTIEQEVLQGSVVSTNLIGDIY